ncbi:MAG: insulinase family protein [Acidobacteria bacterium]|nr:insulinase family protein [Acidobacteriota bacterium]MBV9477994.1 insulinase family protein [Acidobacteriota bacterium]
MRRRLSLPLLLHLSFVVSLALSASAATTIAPIPYKQRVLPNGLTVYSVQDRSTPTVAVHVWYHVGSKDDPPGRSGFAHLFEHMMFKSTKHMKSEMLDRLTEDVGGSNNATTMDDVTVYFEVVPSNYLESLLWAEADRLGTLNVDDANFKSERDVVKEEYRRGVLASPYGRLFNAIPKDSYARHPYKRPGIGSIEELDAATIDDVRAFHTTFYRPDNAYLFVIGDFDQQQLDGWIDRYFMTVAKPAADIPRVHVDEPERDVERRYDEYAPNVPLPATVLTWLTPNAGSPDAAALNVAMALLTQGESSRLEEKLVRAQIAQELLSETELLEDRGIFVLGAILSSEHAPADAEHVIKTEVRALAETPVGAAELEKAKNLLVTDLLRQRETNDGKAFVLAEAVLIDHDAADANNGIARVQAVTPADIQRVAKQYLVDAKAVVINYLDESTKKPVGGVR